MPIVVRNAPRFLPQSPDPARRVLAPLMLAAAWIASATGCGATNTQQPAAVETAPSAQVHETRPSPEAQTPPTSDTVEVPAFFATLVDRARQDATRPAPADDPVALPESLAHLDPAQYATIRFRPEKSLWRHQPGNFEVQFFHLGSHYRRPVTMFELDSPGATEPSPIAFSRDMFSYDGVTPPAPDAPLGFTGLRLHAPLNRPDYRDEVVVFQGSSYFRPVARGLAYGLSGRGLSIDTAQASGEEFPRFTSLYLVRPAAGDAAVWILARLDSHRATGAYAFHVRPGPTTVIEVLARVFLRATPSVLGVAPLTSMFLFGEQTPARFGDFRPEVHDSDGLALHAANGERLFRPLRNPRRTTLSAFRMDSLRGFGLLQRDRDFSHYQDLVEHYQDRPSAWVEPLGDWGKGSVRLLEIATKLESDDNIGAFWAPDTVPADGLDLHYRIHVGRGLPITSVFGRVVSTHQQKTARGIRYLVDFDTGQESPPSPAQVTLEVSASGGEVLQQQVQANPYVRGLRASFEIGAAAGARDVELRAYLRKDADVLTETWSYLWQPEG